MTHGTFRFGATAQQLLVGGLGCPAARGILVPRPGMESATPVLGGRFLTTGPPGKSPKTAFPKPHRTFTHFTLSEKGFSGGAVTHFTRVCIILLGGAHGRVLMVETASHLGADLLEESFA